MCWRVSCEDHVVFVAALLLMALTALQLRNSQVHTEQVLFSERLDWRKCASTSNAGADAV